MSERVLRSATELAPAPHTGVGTASSPRPVAELRKGGQKPSPPVTALNPLITFFSSLRLTVACLAFGIVLVLWGTLAQVEIGTFKAQNEFFRSLFIYWTPKGSALRIPIFPGGYSLGFLLLTNLLTAHFTRFKWTIKKAGIWITHFGLILLLLGQLLTDMLARESVVKLYEGETKNYSEDFRGTELVLIDKTDPQSDLVFSIPDKLVREQAEIHDSRLPLALRIKKVWPNAAVVKPDSQAPMAVPSGATAGNLKDYRLIPEAPVSENDQRNSAAALVEVLNGTQPLGSFFLTVLSSGGQSFSLGGKQYELGLRFVRYYYPFSLTLLKATHEQYRGTKTPKNFASRVRVQNSDQNEARETTIYMNNPLRYAGLTFYQYQMLAGEMAREAGEAPNSVFQVVRNPGWLTPYLSCVLITLGLVIQFGMHLVGFVRRRSISPKRANAAA
ncbi:MAG: ResB protein required for cytochrome C biosynthesis [Verrucomicrobia bacterium]|nr:MAG: ResB protein required for cytochrome C biosynthesis [Verrucomicrobiota bacterium]